MRIAGTIAGTDPSWRPRRGGGGTERHRFTPAEAARGGSSSGGAQAARGRDWAAVGRSGGLRRGERLRARLVAAPREVRDAIERFVRERGRVESEKRLGVAADTWSRIVDGERVLVETLARVVAGLARSGAY